MSKEGKKHSRIDLRGYHEDKGIKLKRIPQAPSRTNEAFWSENGGLDEFRQVGWISMNSGQVWGLEGLPADGSDGDVPDMTPLYINVRGDG